MATLLDSLVGSCINKLQDIIKDEAILILGVKEKLMELQRRMNQIRRFLHDAERRRMEESAVNDWLGQLRDAMYDADDIIDIARCKGSKLLLDYSLPLSRKSHTCSGLSLSPCFSKFWVRHEVAVKIRSLNKRIENIKNDKVFALLEDTQPAGNVSAQSRRISSNLMEPNLVGKEVAHACRRVVDLVLAHKDNKSYKVAIAGLGGVGKTTLAQKIYNDQKIKGTFNKHAWVCVSKDNKSNMDLLKELLRNIGVYQDHGESVGELQNSLALAIKDKSVFLVLDDVWQSDIWIDLLRTPLAVATTVILVVTTRLETAAVEIGVNYVHRVDLMPLDVGWELLWKSMNINDEKEVQNLHDIGIDIIQKCGGLPLAIKLLARVLARKDRTENEWKKILRKDAWSMSNLPSEIKGALYLSYEELPYHLKQCFVYCAMYPEDVVIYRNDIVRLWLAEGFIEEKDGQLLEDTAEEYYYELISRNLLQPNYLSATLHECRVHDLLRQLACYLSREECFVGDPESIRVDIRSKIRRILIFTKKDMVVLPSMDKDEYKVRTWRTQYHKALRIDHTIFERIPHIRVLDLTNSHIESIPSCIGSLIHLRLLDLDGTDVSFLPESICHLMNLQIFNLNRCDALHSLPSGITELSNLRCLGLWNTPISQVPKGIGRLRFLNDLQGYPVGGNNYNNSKMQDGWNLEELGPLLLLRRLDLRKLERVVCCNTDSLLIDKKNLKELALRCTECRDEPYLEEYVVNIGKVFEMLIPPHNLELLFIKDFFGREFPTWLGTATHLSSVKYLLLVGCKSCVHLPTVGQLPNLKYLKIKGASTITKIGPEFVGSELANFGPIEVVAFPKLETLVIEDMPNLEEWTFIVEEATVVGMEGCDDRATVRRHGQVPPPGMQLLPRLLDLSLVSCPKLRALPRQLGRETTSLKELHLQQMSSLKVVENLPFIEGVLVQECEGLERLSNLPRVRELKVAYCPNLRYVEELGSLEQLWLDENMQDLSSLWVPRLKHQRQQLHGEDLDVYTWTDIRRQWGDKASYVGMLWSQ